ncbi:MAG TPA: amidohydrolase family protein [bacterium]|nr:amidohydrolase family protein [bacterium]
MIIDVHTHFFPPGYLERLQRGPDPYAIGRDADGRTILTLHGARIVTMTQEMTSPEDRLRDMAQLGIDFQIVSVTIPNVYFGPPERRRDLARMANDGLADLPRRYPAKFAALASVPLSDPDAAVQELDRAVLELGMVGAVVGSNVEGRYLDDPSFMPFFERAQSLEVPILVHPMPPADADATFGRGLVPLLGFVFNTSASAARMVLAGVFERLPRLTMILGHLGGTLPYLMQRLDNGYRAYPEARAAIPHPPSHYLKRLFYDTVSFSIPSLRCALGAVGPEHIVMGTDYPHVIGDITAALHTVRALDLPEAAVGGILGGTAERLFPRLAPHAK